MGLSRLGSVYIREIKFYKDLTVNNKRFFTNQVFICQLNYFLGSNTDDIISFVYEKVT